MKKEDKHMDNLILTGWGWKEYAVSAAVTLRALNGQADSKVDALKNAERWALLTVGKLSKNCPKWRCPLWYNTWQMKGVVGYESIQIRVRGLRRELLRP